MVETSIFGLCFKLNEENLTASLISSSYAKGSLTIPRSISYNSKNYVIISVNKNAFKSNKNIKSINFSEDSGLLSVDQDSFYQSSIESISFPSSLKELKEGWCNNTQKLENATISAKNDNFLISKNNDFIFGKSKHSKSGEFDILLFASRNIEHVFIPSFVRCIGSHSFGYCTKIKSFQFSEDTKIESINDSAFNNSSIKNIDIPKNLNHLNEGWCQNLNKLRSISIHPQNKNFSMINNGKFLVGKSDKNSSTFDVLLYIYRDSQKVEIPKCIKHIGSYAFHHCLKLKSVTFPKNSELVSIGRNAFSYTSIEKVSFPSKLEEIGDSSFEFCQKLKTIEFPPKSKIHKIGNASFSYTIIESIIIPKSVKIIGCSSFYCCRPLKSIEFEENSELIKIDEKAFSSTMIESIKIPQNLIEIGSECFRNCSLLKIIEFPLNSNLKIIGESAFCQTAIESISIPSSVQTIKSSAFSLCDSLKSVTLPENSELQSFEPLIFNDSSIEKVSIPPKLIECKQEWCNKTPMLKTFQVINNDRFKVVDDKFLVYKSDEKSDTYDVLLVACRDIKNAVIPSYIETICSDSFSYCNELQTVEFSENSKLKVIEKNAFSFSSVEKISLSQTVEKIGEFAFYSCQNLKALQNFENIKIQKIEKHTFSMSGIEKLSIPASVVEFDDFWCDGLMKLKKISISSENPYFSFINDSFLVGKTNKNSDVFDSLLFSRRDIQQVIIPSFIKVISKYAFGECDKIESINFEKKSNLISIEHSSFYGSPINKIVIPSSVENIDEFAFFNCNLNSIEFEENSKLIYIKKSAFSNNSFNYVIIPQNVSFIGEHAFYNNNNLTCVDFLCEYVTLGDTIFDFASVKVLSFPNAKKIVYFRNILFNLNEDVILLITSTTILE